MKKSFFVVTFLLSTSLSLALSTLPKYAYLRYNDNQKEVVILQQILNSDPNTKIADSGVGSPGKETWFFGKLTEVALKKFQEKHSLDATGEINFKTWEKLNEYVNKKNTPKTTTKTTSATIKPADTQKQKEEKNIYLNDTSKSEPGSSTSTMLNDSFLSSVLGKYSSLLSPSTYFTSTPQAQTSPTYSASTPYYNPGTGSYQSSPVTNSGGGYSPAQSYSGMNAPGYYTQNMPFGGGYSGYSPYSNSGTQSGPVTMGNSVYDNNPSGDLASKFTKLPGGWLSGRTSHFGTEMNGSKDKSYAPYGPDWCNAAMNSRISTCDPSACLVALPLSAQIYFFGSDDAKRNLAQIRQGTNKQQLAAAGGAAFYKKIGGSPIEIINTKNNTCTVAPLWDTGPGEKENGGFVIDVTPCIKKTLQDSGTAFISKFRPLPQGQEPCQGYKYIKTPVLTK